MTTKQLDPSITLTLFGCPILWCSFDKDNPVTLTLFGCPILWCSIVKDTPAETSDQAQGSTTHLETSDQAQESTTHQETTSPVWMSHHVLQHQQGHSHETSDQAQGSTNQIQETTSVDGSHGSVGKCNWCWKSVSHKDRASAETPDATVSEPAMEFWTPAAFMGPS